jgi:hypothetical protein
MEKCPCMFYMWLGKLLFIVLLGICIGMFKIIIVQSNYIPLMDAQFIYGMIMGVAIAAILR